jgi:carboxypeptidase PM20D1
MKRFLTRVLPGSLGLVLIVMVVRTATLQPLPKGPDLAVSLPLGVAESESRLAALIQVPTVSIDGQETDTTAFSDLHGVLRELWPEVHAHLGLETVGGSSLLFTWTGLDVSLPPVILQAHMDVVPADTGDAWLYPPFSGSVDSGTVWGRGALDDKGSITAILDAVTGLLDSSFQPARTVYIAFGHDEEVGGTNGAAAIAELLKARDVRPAFVLDEGGFVAHGAIPGVDTPVAVIGTAEKGSMSLRLSAAVAGGHSSIPPKQMAISTLADALARLDNNPMPARLEAATWDLFRATAPHMPPAYRLLFANRWLTQPLLLAVLAAKPTTNATIRTTTAFTMLDAGTKPNVLPDRADAVVNFRLLPGDSVADVIGHVERTIADLPIEITLLAGTEASAVSPADGAIFQYLGSAIRAAYQDSEVIVAPYLATGGTDAKHFQTLSEHLYRFLPFDVYPSRDGILLHGVNERLEAGQLAQAVRFYATLLSGLDSLPAETP